VDPLQGRIQNYAWGSRNAIAELLGNPSPSPRPEAELWLGAHPSAPSLVLRDGVWRSLLDVIAAKPGVELGAAVVAQFGPRLPFLLKVLAAETPLSLQAHPNMAQARAGFAAEEAAHVPHDAPNRNYKDASHKPELLCALGRFDAFSGFRHARDTLRLLRELGAAPLLSYGAVLERTPDPSGLRSLYGVLASLAATERDQVVRSTLEACAAHRDRAGELARECAWILRLGELYPGDIGIVLALLLNLVELEPGHALYLSAGNLHVYLRGVGIEIMANSDNVLRGGLTPKHVDPSELMRVLTFADEPVPVVVPRGPSIEQIYATPAPEFRLSRIELDERTRFRSGPREGPEILLCVAGRIVAHPAQGEVHEVVRGAAVFVSAGDGGYELDGAGTVFRAAVGRITRADADDRR
jgi:mannose-6-phosphate isomerase